MENLSNRLLSSIETHRTEYKIWKPEKEKLKIGRTITDPNETGKKQFIQSCLDLTFPVNFLNC